MRELGVRKIESASNEGEEEGVKWLQTAVDKHQVKISLKWNPCALEINCVFFYLSIGLFVFNISIFM